MKSIFEAGKARSKAVFQPCDRCHKKNNAV